MPRQPSPNLTSDAAKQNPKTNLKFGTAGIRAPMGEGPNKLNNETVALVAQAVAQFLEMPSSQPGKSEKEVVVGFDGRLNSRDFADKFSNILNQNGVETKVFSEPVATPLLAFAVRDFKADLGVMITASHNPPADNGIKLYLASGAQLGTPYDKEIEAILANLPLSQPANITSRSSVKPNEQGSIEANQILDKYLEKISEFSFDLDSGLEKNKNKNKNKNKLKIAYTALHGVGAEFVKRIFEKNEISEHVEFLVEPSQEQPNGEFPGLEFPNPEEPGCLDAVKEFAKTNQADLIFANDPDADRLAVLVFDEASQTYIQLSGNQLGVVLGYAVIKKFKNREQQNTCMATTFVSSQMLGEMAKHESMKCGEVLTGFSNIAEFAQSEKEKNNIDFLFGYEEAIGYLIGDYIYDKDGLSAALRVAELAVKLSVDNKNLLDYYDEISLKYGVFESHSWSLRYGEDDLDKKNLLQNIRGKKLSLKTLGDSKICKLEDLREKYKSDKNLVEKSDVLIFKSEDATRLIIRPSGTEPKIKFYLEKSVVSNKEELKNVREAAQKNLREIEQQVLRELKF